MKKEDKKGLVFAGIGCVVFLALSCVYSIFFNDGRLVKETNLSEYVFSVKDLPMLLAGAALFIYVICFLLFLFKKQKKQEQVSAGYTRRISPFLGFLGFFGFFGFLGFWSYEKYHIIAPFLFFIFFAFFGFFFEGRLSGTLEDEMYQEHKREAEIKAYKTGFVMLFLVIGLVGGGMFSKNVEWCAIFMMIAISLIYAVVMILKVYFLYRYEREA